MPELAFVVFAPPGHDPCLVPSTRVDQKPFRRLGLKHGDVLTAKFTKRRNGKFHRLVMGMTTFVFENQERFATFDGLRHFLSLRTSFVIEAEDKATGQTIRIPRSWSYEEMDETEFQQLASELVDVIIAEFFPTEDANWLRKSVEYQAFIDGVLGFVS